MSVGNSDALWIRCTYGKTGVKETLEWSEYNFTFIFIIIVE